MYDIHIFDFDYTLYKTFESIYVWSPRGDFIKNNKKCFRISPIELHSYKISNDEEINEDSYQEFDSVSFERAIPIRPVLDIFNNAKNKIILSARPQKAEIDISKKFNNVKFIGLGNGSAEKKFEVIKQYNNPIVYDDSLSLISILRKNNIPCVYISHDIDCLKMFFYEKGAVL